MALLSSKLQSRLAKRAIEIREVELEWFATRKAARENIALVDHAGMDECYFKRWGDRYYKEAGALRKQANALGKDQKLDKQLLRMCYADEANWWGSRYE